MIGADRAMSNAAVHTESAAGAVGWFATTVPQTRAAFVARLPANKQSDAQASAKSAAVPFAAAAVLPHDLRHFLVYRFLTRD